jgi:hypothetical protein
LGANIYEDPAQRHAPGFGFAQATKAASLQGSAERGNVPPFINFNESFPISKNEVVCFNPMIHIFSTRLENISPGAMLCCPVSSGGSSPNSKMPQDQIDKLHFP